MITTTIAGNEAQLLNHRMDLQDRIDEQTTLTIGVYDPDGTLTLTQHQPITIVDDTAGTLYAGYIDDWAATLLYPQPARIWSLTCSDQTKLLSRHTSKKRYGSHATGLIAVDQVQRYASDDGMVCHAALRWDELLSDWEAGTLSGTVATSNASNGNEGGGDLELEPAGDLVSFVQESQADFTAGSGDGLSSPVSGGLTFTSSAAMKFEAICSIEGLSNAYTYVKIWSGSYVITSGDALVYDLWIADSSPECKIALDLTCTDGTTLRDTIATTDGLGYAAHPKTDLANVAKNTWYHRALILGFGSFIGKTISSITIACEGEQLGTYTAYVRQILIDNGGTPQQQIFQATDTALPMVPQQLQNTGYSTMRCTLVTAYERHGYFFSPGFDLSATALVRASYVAWDLSLPNDSFTALITASIDGGKTYLPCANQAAIPGLLPGMNTTGKSLGFVYIFDNSGNDPTLTPVLSRIAGNVQPAFTCSKTDSITTTSTSGGWGAGTLTSTATTGNALQLDGSARNWNDAVISNQTLYGSSSPAQGTVKQQFFLTSGNAADVRSRLDFAGSSIQDFTAEVDVILGVANTKIGLVYRCTGWQNNNDTYAYVACISTTQVQLARGTNSASGSGSATNIGTPVSITLTAGQTYRLKVVVSGNSHKVYVNDVLYISQTDSTFTAAGYVGLRFYNNSGSTQTGTFDNFGVVKALSGTWVSPAIDLHSLGTISDAALNLEIDPGCNLTTCSFGVDLSLDNGSSWSTLTNVATVSSYFQAYPLPGLPPGTDVSSITQAKLRINLATSTASVGETQASGTPTLPRVSAISLFVVGAYSSSGTRVSPALSCAAVGRAAATLTSWTATVPDEAALTVETSIDNGSSWQAATNGGAISGISVQPATIFDSFDTDTSADYDQSTFSGTTGSWAWDTANSRLTGSGGSNGTFLWNAALTGADSLVAADFDQADGSGLIANYQDASTLYFVQIWDDSGTGTQSSVALYKRSGGSNSQLGSTATISFPRGRFRRFILDVQTGELTVRMDGSTIISATDGSPLAAGQSGLYLNTLLRCYALRLQQYGQDVTGITGLKSRVTLTSTDPTATPQLLDLQVFVSSPDITVGTTIPDASFVRTYLDDNLGELNQRSEDTWWYVRPDKSTVFQDRLATPAPWILDSANIGMLGNQRQGDLLVDGLEVSGGASLYRNRQILTGVLDTATFSEIKPTDGSTRSWTTTYNLAAAPTITVNGQLATVGIKDVDTGRDFYYVPGGNSLEQDSSAVVLTGADVLLIVYLGEFETEVVRDNVHAGDFPGTKCQDDVAADDGTSGVIEQVTDVSGKRMFREAAESYADQLLQRHGKSGRTVTFRTLRSGLLPGQLLPVYIPEHGIIDGQFLILSLTIQAEIAPSVPGGVLYWFSVEASENANLGSPWKILSTLLKAA